MIPLPLPRQPGVYDPGWHRVVLHYDERSEIGRSFVYGELCKASNTINLQL
jgi:hypothetical protein